MPFGVVLPDGLDDKDDDLHDQVGDDDEELQGAEGRRVCLSCLDHVDLLGEVASAVLQRLADTASSS